MSERGLARWKWIVPTLLVLAFHGSGWVLGRYTAAAVSDAVLVEKVSKLEQQSADHGRMLAEIDRKVARVEGRLNPEAALLSARDK